MNDRRVFEHQGQVVTRDIVGETLLVPIRDNAADMHHIFALNPVAAHVWKALDGTTSFGQLVASVCAAFEVDEERAERDLKAFLDELLQAGLVREA